MVIWAISFFCLFLSIRFFGHDFSTLSQLMGSGRQRRDLQKVANSLREIEETLMAGMVPSADRWEILRSLPEPWGTLSLESLKALRACGGSLLPTLKRLRHLSEDHAMTLEDAKAKSSQAFAQALACALLVPVLGVTLYQLLPGVEQNRLIWLLACGLALALTAIASIWLMHLADVARWGGLDAKHRSWVLSSQCAGERFLALVRAGTPPDLAWTKGCQLLKQEALELSMAWGYSIWEAPNENLKGATERVIVHAGAAIKKAVQISLMEGRPCTERVETALLSLRQEIRSQVDRELALLATRALKPLFLFVAPALLGLLICGLWLAASESMGDVIGAL